MKPRKVDGPGPGSHKLPSSIRAKRRPPWSAKMTTFGTSAREFNDLPKNTPAPNKYRPVVFTEASHAYSIPGPPEVDLKDIQMNK